jgi:D-alanine-D-alanine ligase
LDKKLSILYNNPPALKRERITVGLLFGGSSAEHEVSLVSAASVYKNLDRKKYDTVSIYINKEGLWRIVESPLLSPSSLNQGEFFPFLPWRTNPAPKETAVDIYFPVLHGPYGEDGTIQGLFEMADVPYVGATVLASALGMDKALAKTLFRLKNLPVVQHSVLSESDWQSKRRQFLSRIRQEFQPPFFIKPANLGSSIGISKVRDYDQSEKAIDEAFQYDRKILIEEGITGRELECSVLGNENPRASLPGELIPFREFYNYKDKYVEAKTSFIIPAKLPSSVVREVQRIALEAYLAIDCSGMARIDFFYDEEKRGVLLNEINTIPGFTEISMYPKLWEVSGLPYAQLLETLINLGFQRHRNKKRTWKRFIP